jgi:electron transfer flavoprotein alpha subunit
MAGIWILGENRELTGELLTAGGELAAATGEKISVLLWKGRSRAEEYFALGADEILVLPELPEEVPPEALIPVITGEAKTSQPGLILLPATVRGREMAARVAAGLGTGLCSDAVAVRWNGERKTFEMERLAYGGMAVQKVVFRTAPAMATIPPRTFAPRRRKRAGPARSGSSPVRLRPPSRSWSGKSGNGRSGISGRRGSSCAPDGASRSRRISGSPGNSRRPWAGRSPAPGPLGGIPLASRGSVHRPFGHFRQAGTVHRSGRVRQVQHITGIRDAKVIAAVNKDENAPSSRPPTWESSGISTGSSRT